VKAHKYVLEHGYLVCQVCGTADNKKPYHGFRWWLAGVGYHVEPECKYDDVASLFASDCMPITPIAN